MKKYELYLNKKNIETVYIDSINSNSHITKFLKNKSLKSIHFYDPVDNYLSRRIKKSCSINDIELTISFTCLTFLSDNDRSFEDI